MKVVFLETVEGSGTMGEVKDVARGYARNYLLPRGFAAPATPQVLVRAERLREIEEERQRAEDEKAQGLVGKFERPIVVTARVGEQGRLYGSVTNADIAEKAGEILGEDLDRRRILLPEAIRRVGVYTIGIRLSRNVTPDVQVVVVAEDAPEGVEAAVEALLAPPVEPEVQTPAAEVEVSLETETENDDADGASESGSSDTEEETA
ncbi:MAG: 50S ribosomal protein L9 [Chloroflexi bacterium]|nr:50S ribosomal protein L9 [Chloroflexota bacterium]